MTPRDRSTELTLDADFEHEHAEAQEPAVVFIPSERKGEHDAEVTVELRQTNDDRLAVLAYKSLESLVAGCGERQPWVAMPPASVAKVAEQAGADLVLWDAGLPEEERRDAPSEGEG